MRSLDAFASLWNYFECMNSFSVLTYNVKFNSALPDVTKIISTHAPDVICLQEVMIGKKQSYRELFPGYNLAATSGSFYRIGKTYGQATFYKKDTFFQVGSRSVFLPKTYYEIALTLFTRKGPRTALLTDLVFRSNLQPISICNLHLTALVATNQARNKQLKEAFDELDLATDSEIDPVVILGDFNYPFRKKGLEKIMTAYGLKEATDNILYTQTSFMKMWKNKLKFDFVLYHALTHTETKLLNEFTTSDHYPILSSFQLS